MKILHVLNGSHFGGASVMAAELAAAQIALGADAQVCLLEGGSTAERIRRLGVPVLASDPVGPFSSKRKRWAALEQGLEECLFEARADLVQSHLPLTNLLCSRLKYRIPEFKWIATMHNSWRAYLYSHDAEGNPLKKVYQLGRYALGERWSTRNCEVIVNVADATGLEWRKVGIPASKMRTIYNGRFAPPAGLENENRRAQWNIPPGAAVIGSLGFFDRRKGFDLLLKAFLHIREKFPAAHLVLAGGDIDGHSSLRAHLQKVRDSSRHADHIHILGTQSSGYEFLQNLDIFVNASRQEAFALVICEAMHVGLPCVVSSAGGNPEAIRDGIDGLVFQSGNVDDLARKLEHLLADPKTAESMGASGKVRAHTYLTLDRCAQDYLNLYKEILKN